MEHAYYTFHPVLRGVGVVAAPAALRSGCSTRTSRSCPTAALWYLVVEHELGQPDVYTDETDESCYVRLRIVDPRSIRSRRATHLAVWTTTPLDAVVQRGGRGQSEVEYTVSMVWSSRARWSSRPRRGHKPARDFWDPRSRA